MTYYKVLLPRRMPAHSGSGQWPPSGEPREVRGELMPCAKEHTNALHGCRIEDLSLWLVPDCEIWELEYEGGVEVHYPGNDKVYGRKARLGRRLGRLTARDLVALSCDWVEHVLPLYPGYSSPLKNAIALVRRWIADGSPTGGELSRISSDVAAAPDDCLAITTAASYAAATAAEIAYAVAAADDYPEIAYAAYAADNAAAAAAYAADAAADAADAAADAAAERRWQGERVLAYLVEGRET